MLPISEVRVRRTAQRPLVGHATLTLGDCFVVRGLKIMEDKRGRLFVAMPSRRRPGGTYQDVAHPITREFQQAVETAVLEAYRNGDDPEGAGARSPIDPGLGPLEAHAGRRPPWDPSRQVG